MFVKCWDSEGPVGADEGWAQEGRHWPFALFPNYMHSYKEEWLHWNLQKVAGSPVEHNEITV